MSAGEGTKELSSLLKTLRGSCADGAQGVVEEAARPMTVIDGGEPVLGQFVRSFLLWESTSAKASAALRRVEAGVVDFNELRICLPDELVEMIGERYPWVEERALRLRSALNQIYSREHATTLQHLTTLSKREAFDYLISLDGVTGYVAARVTLLVLGGHCAPVDSRILRRLIEAKVASANADVESATGLVERKVRAGDLLEAYGLLQTWADEASYPLPVEGEGPRFVPKRRSQMERPAEPAEIASEEDGDEGSEPVAVSVTKKSPAMERGAEDGTVERRAASDKSDKPRRAGQQAGDGKKKKSER